MQATQYSNQKIAAYAKEHDIILEGLTILGGQMYINGTGLLVKAKQCGLKSIKVEMVKTATKEDMTAGAKATVELKDGSVFEDFGYASPTSVQMRTLHNPDFLNMMSVTRAKNRALRSATGVGLVSAEEMAEANTLYGNPENGGTGTNLDKIIVDTVLGKDGMPEKVIVNENVEKVVKALAKARKTAPAVTAVTPQIVAEEKPLAPVAIAPAGEVTAVRNAEAVFGVPAVEEDAEKRKVLSNIIRGLMVSKGKDEKKMLLYFKCKSLADMTIAQLNQGIDILNAI